MGKVDSVKRLIVITALVKYPSSDNSYLSSNSYTIEVHQPDALEVAITDFRSHVEVDGFKILNIILYVVPDEQIRELGKK